jgi:hypothetical protein
LSNATLQKVKSREDLFDELKFDRATPDEAEAEAARRGWAPLAPEPDIAKFDPMAEQQWTFPMAMAWIAMRSVEAVRQVWNEYRKECPVWRRQSWRDGPGGEVHKGWLLYYREPATSLGLEVLAIVSGLEEQGTPPLMTVAEARNALWSVLRDGLLTASGVARSSGIRTRIEASEWQILEPHYSDHRDEVGRSGPNADYTEPLVSSKGVRHFWGPRREVFLLPPLFPPEGDGYMPLGCAAQWIATEGGAIQFDPTDASVWGPAFDKLLGAIASEKVRVVGLRGGAREKVDGYHFAGCLVDYPFSEPSFDLITSDTLYLRCYPYIDIEHWRNGFDDALISRHQDQWKQLMVEKGDVRDRWPFTLFRGTGAPGRPSKSIHLLLDEFERRVGKDECAPSLREEATALLSWIKTTHPSKDRPVLKTVENNIRQAYKAWKAAPK